MRLPFPAGFVAAALLTSQAPSTPPQFRARANIIQLDVSVMYGDRRPVRGLTAHDFVVLDDKREQPIETFSEVTLPDWQRLPEGWLRNTPPDVVSNAAAPSGRLVAIVIDDIAPIPTPKAALALRTIAALIVEQLSPGDRAAVFFGRVRERNERFTSERARLIAAIDRIGPDLPGRPYAPRLTALSALRGAVNTMALAAPQSKTVFFISPGAPVNLGASFFGPDVDFVAAFDDALVAAAQTNVRIHCVDPTEPMPTSSPPTAKDARQKALQKDMLTRLADAASGRLLTNDDFLPRRLNEVFNESKTYYLIGYRAPDRVKRGVRRSVEVRITQPGLVVHTRDGYDPVVEPNAVRPGAPSAALSQALSPIAGLPSPEVPLRVTAIVIGAPEGEDVPVVLLTGVLREPDASSPAGGHVDSLLRVTNQRTPPRDTVARLQADVGSGEDEDPVLHEFVLLVTLKPGSHLVRVAAERTSIGAVGSVVATIDVPDPRRTPLWLSGVAIVSDRTSPRTIAEGWATPRSGIPTIRRDFGRSERVTATARITQGGKNPLDSVRVSARIISATGRAVTLTQSLIANEFARGRSSDVTFTLPMDQLTAGPYLLTFEANSGRYRMQRDVPFSVR